MKRFTLRIGYGTTLALVVAALLWWSGYLPPQKPATDLRAVYMADRSGKLRRVDPSPIGVESRLQVKEPARILQFADELKLTPAQRKHIEEISARWQLEQAQWLAALQKEQARIEREMPSGTVPYSTLRQQMQPYSELSRAYADRRALFWNRAVSVLSSQQRQKLSR